MEKYQSFSELVSNALQLLIEKQKQRDIAKQYNVSENVISTIKHNTRYRGIGLI